METLLTIENTQEQIDEVIHENDVKIAFLISELKVLEEEKIEKRFEAAENALFNAENELLYSTQVV